MEQRPSVEKARWWRELVVARRCSTLRSEIATPTVQTPSVEHGSSLERFYLALLTIFSFSPRSLSDAFFAFNQQQVKQTEASL